MLTFQIAATDTPGELGTIANLEQHNRRHQKYVDGHDAVLAKVLGALPDECRLAGAYAGPARIVVPTVRTLAEPGESLALKVMILTPGAGRDDAGAPSGTLCRRTMGAGEFAKVPLKHVARRC
jgi:hypothetical protein